MLDIISSEKFRIAVLLLVLAGAVFLFTDIYPDEYIIEGRDQVIEDRSTSEIFQREILSKGPEIGKIVSEDPFFEDFRHVSPFFGDFVDDAEVKCYEPLKWRGEYPCLVNRTYDNADSFMWLHPLNRTKPRVIEQDVSLGDEDYYLHFGVTNVADEEFFTEGCSHACTDSVVRIEVRGENRTETVFLDVVSGEESIRNVVLDISDFRNEEITIVAEGHAGGYCDLWCAQSTAISNFFVYRPDS